MYIMNGLLPSYQTAIIREASCVFFEATSVDYLYHSMYVCIVTYVRCFCVSFSLLELQENRICALIYILMIKTWIFFVFYSQNELLDKIC